MLSSSLDALLKLFKTTSPPKLVDYARFSDFDSGFL